MLPTLPAAAVALVQLLTSLINIS